VISDTWSFSDTMELIKEIRRSLFSSTPNIFLKAMSTLGLIILIFVLIFKLPSIVIYTSNNCEILFKLAVFYKLTAHMLGWVIARTLRRSSFASACIRPIHMWITRNSPTHRMGPAVLAFITLSRAEIPPS
jgi:hypothetical protein